MEVLINLVGSFFGAFLALWIHEALKKEPQPTQINCAPDNSFPLPPNPWHSSWGGTIVSVNEKLEPVSMTPEAEYEIEQSKISTRSPEEDE